MKFLLIMITWMGAVVPMTQELPVHDETDCNAMKDRIQKSWKDAPKDFGSIIECRPDNTRFKKE